MQKHEIGSYIRIKCKKNTLFEISTPKEMLTRFCFYVTYVTGWQVFHNHFLSSRGILILPFHNNKVDYFDYLVQND